MYHIVICDDEEKILQDISAIIDNEFVKQQVEIKKTLVMESCQLQEILEQQQVDVLFLDIDMPHMNGMEIAAWMQEKQIPVLLVFVTNQDTLVYQTFRYQPFGFIRKSVFEEEIEDVVTRLCEKMNYNQDFIVGQQGSENIKLKLQDIIFMEADSNYVHVVTEEKRYRFRETLTALEKRLETREFIRIHKGFLINGKKMHILKANYIEMEDGSQLPIGRSYSEEVKKKVMLLLRKYR